MEKALRQKIQDLARTFTYEHFDNPTWNDQMVIENAMLLAAILTLEVQRDVRSEQPSKLV